MTTPEEASPPTTRPSETDDTSGINTEEKVADKKPTSRGGIWLVLALGAMLTIVATIAALSAMPTVMFVTAAGPLDRPTEVTIPAASGANDIAYLLVERGVIDQAWLFILTTRLTNTARDLQAGEYRFEPAVSLWDVVRQLQQGNTVRHRLTIPEGASVWAVVERLNRTEQLVGEVPSPLPPEGSLMPDTYLFSRGTTRAQLINQMTDAQQQFLNDQWTQRDTNLPLTTPEQVLVLASIVEKEAADQRARVAGVFINRLRRGMLLQADATVVYALGRGQPLGRPLTRRDLMVDSPYNTYIYSGLPPQPIANPGRAAIMAVLHPEEHDYLYFVADGTGGHVFSETLREHNRHARCWQRTGRGCAHQ